MDLYEQNLSDVTLNKRRLKQLDQIFIEELQEFKEVSSRDGGLVETLGKIKLFSLFYEKALKRLERYVVGVLWGEGFIRRNYFFDTNIAQKYRNELDEDKDKDSYEDIVKNIGSKIDFVNLIKTLSDDDGVKIIYCNKDENDKIPHV